MSSTRALRLLNSVENGTTNSSQLENLLASTTGRLPELAVLFSVAGQASRITTNQKTVETLVSSQSALSVMVESGVMVNSIAQSPTARSAVKSAGASVLRRFLTSRHNDENVNSSWADDFAWTRQQLPSLGTASGMAETATWKALTFGNGKYVAIGYDTSAVAVSSDGVSWTLGQMPLTLKYTSAAYGGPGGNERFVAVADGTSTYVHSTDGLIWTAASLPKIANWQHVYFRAGKFTAVASNNTEVATSTDGLSWTIAASNNIFTQTKTVAGGAQGSAVTLALSGTGTATVPSGVTTLNVTGRGGAGSTQTVNLQGPGSAGATSLAFNNGTFVGTFGNSIVKYSTDGCATWTSCNIPNTHQYTHVYFVNNKFYVLTKNHSLIFSSSNGINFTSASLNITQNWLSIAFDGSRLIAVGAAADQNELDVNTNNAAYSTDGINWTTFTFPASRVYTSITYGNNKWVVVGWDRGSPSQNATVNVYYSTNGGVNWTGATLPSNQGWSGVAYGNNCFLAIEGTGSYCAYSNDGVTWTQGIGFGYNKYKIQFWSKHSVFVITTDAGTFITTDGHSDNRIFSPGTTYDNYFGGLVITGDRAYVSNRINGNIYYSTDSQLFTNSETTQTLGANASVTVNGTAYTFNGSANATTPNSRTDTITLTGNAPVAFTYSCPAGTLVSATFIASDVQIAANGTGTATIPAGTSKLKITATGAAGSEAITIAIPNTNGDPAWEAVAYGAGRYVAIRGTGSTQNLATSTDGATWTKANLPGATSGWTDITFGNGKFVAVRTSASDQLFAYSTDGITWSVVTPTALAPAAAGNWKKVAYGAGKFVAVGSGTSANVAYSTDGINWSTALIPGGLLWNGVTYGADRFVAVSFDAAANGANNIAYSTDGVTWTRTGLTGDSTARFTSIAFGGGKYLAVGNKQASSSDGVTWSVVGTAKNLTNVVYVLSQYVAFGAANGALAQYSADGVSWTNTSLGGGIVPSSGAFTIGAFGGSRFVMIASGDGQVAYSADARNFVTSTPQTTGANTVVTIAGVNYTFNGTTGANTPAPRTDEVQLDINAPTSVTYNVASGASCVFAYSGGNSTQIINTPVTLLASAYNGSNKYVAVSYLENLVGYSADGVNWSVAVMPANVKWHGVSYGNGVFVAIAYDSSIAATSPDGSTWTQRAMPTSTKWGNVVYGAAGGHVALAEFSSINATTLDGITWTQRAMLELPSTSIEDGQITNVPLSGSGSVIIPSGTTSVTINGRGAAGTDEVTTPIYGPDGVTWTNNLGLPAGLPYRAAYGGDKIVAIRVGAASTNAYYSSNGVTWTAATLPNADWASVVYGNGKFVAVAKGSATTAYSTDGVTWTTGNSGVSSGAFKVIYGNSKFVAVNQQTSNNLFYSTDGITWTAGSINSGSSAWTSVIFANGKFVAIGVAASANAAYSTDGVTWNVVNSHSLSSADSAGIAFGNGKFVGFITSSSPTSTVITTSTDGITWTNPTATGLGAGAGIQGAVGVKSYGFIFVDGKFFIAAATTNVSNGIFQSTDGITWTASNGGTSDIHSWGDVVYTGDKLVAVGYSAVASVGISNNIIVGSQVVTPAVTGVGAAVNINSQSYTFTGSNTSTAPIARVETVSLNASAPTTVTYSAPAGTNVYLTYVALASSASPVTPLMPVQASWTEAAYGNGIFVAVATGSNIAATSPDGVNWTQQSLPVSTQWSHVSFSSGVFLAVSATGSIAATSPDGVTWTQRSLPQIATQGSGNSVSVALANNTGSVTPMMASTRNWISSVYAAGKFVAISASDNIASYSTDGNTWTDVSLPAANSWYSVTYGNGKFVAVGWDKAAYSSDGITWNVCTLPANAIWQTVTYGNGKFVTVSSRPASSSSITNVAAYSADGITWTASTMPSNENWFQVTYGNGKYVAIGSNNGNWVGAYSSNGIAWTASTVGGNPGYNSLIYGGDRFLAVGNSNLFNYSTDGINWIAGSMPSSNNWTRVAYGNGIFVAVANNTNIAAYSTNGTSWTTVNLPTSKNRNALCFGNDKFIAIAYGSAEITVTTDGITWSTTSPNTSGTVTVPAGISTISLTGQGAPGTPGTAVNTALVNNTGGGVAIVPPTGTSQWTSMVYANGKFVAISYHKVGISTDGITWSTSNAPSGVAYWTSITYGNGKFVIVGGPGNTAAYSTDGITWSTSTLPDTQTWTAVTFGNGKFVAVCSDQYGQGNLTYIGAYSTDGITWNSSNMPGGTKRTSIAFGNGKFVVVQSGASGTYRNILYSTDGITWSSVTSPNSYPFDVITFGNGKFVALGYNQPEVYSTTSTDGITWTMPASVGAALVFKSIIYANGKFVAIGENPNISYNATVIYSTDGITWSSNGLPANSVWGALAYNGTNIVALGYYSTNNIAISKDGITWTNTTPNTSGTLTIPAGVTTLTVTGKGDAGVSIGGGETWTQYATPAGSYGTAIAFGGGKFVISAPFGTGVAYSGNGMSWSISNSGNPGNMKSITYGNGKFVGLDNYAASISYSTDGITWARVGNPLTGAYKVTFGNGKFVMIGNTYSGGEYSTLTGNVVGYSTDGINWTSSTISSVAEWSSITYGNGKFVAVADNSNAVAYSTDGITWSTTTLPVIKRFPVITFGNGKFVFIGSSTNSGYDNVIYYSTDGITWVYVKDTIQRYIDITYGNGKFVAISGNYSVITSTNGINWVEGNGLSSNSTNVVYGNGAFVALSAGTNQVSVSTDSVGTYGANTTFTINGTTYTFQGSGTETPPQLRTETITLSGSSSVNATYAVSSSGTLSLTYTPVTQGDPLVISVNGTNYTFAGSTTAGPATSRTETITGLGTGATTINYVMTPTKAATLAYTDAATTLSHAAWSATAYGNSTIVAVSSSGTHAAISADGTNWTKQVLPAGVGAADVVYGNNLFVAVGSSNKAATSSDGISWSQRPMPDNLNYKTVAFGNGKYVALASGGTSANVCAVSPDGITWTSVSLPVIADWKSIAFKDGLFFAVAANTDQALTSPDGSIWTKRTLPATANWAAVTASDKKFVAIANGSTAALVSFDGAKFNMSSPGSGGLAGSSANSKWGLLSYGAGVFVAIAKNSTVAAISSDGISWTDRTLPSDTAWNAITYANGKFVVLAENTTTAAYSADGSVWNPTTLPVSQRWVSVAAGPRLFVAIAKDTSVYLTSKDGIAWTARNLPESGAWSAVRYGSGRYVITNDTTNKVLVSQDGITWTVNESASTGLNALAYGNGIFVGVASNDAGVDVSTDGYNWTQYGLPSISDWCAIRFGNGVFVALANNSAVVATSTDGVTWKQFNLPAAASWKAVAFGRGVFLGVSDSRTAVTNC